MLVARCALLVALALAISLAESLLPFPMPLPGMKLGLANIITIITAFWLGWAPALIVLVVRIVLTAIATGQLSALPFSLIGGGCALLVTLAFARIRSLDSVRLCSMCAAVAHNIGQVAVAVLLTTTDALIVYLPPLLVVGAVCGFITGALAKAVLERLL